MISETRERFLRAIVGIVPAERIEEIHFFPPIKQGGVESGVAVIAAGEPAPVDAPAAAAPSPPAAPTAAAPTTAAPAPTPGAGASPSSGAAPDETAEPFATAETDEASDRPTAVAYPVDGPADLAPADAVRADARPADAERDVLPAERAGPRDEGEPAPSAGSHAAHEHPAHDEMADAVERAEAGDEERDRAAVVERVVPIAARSAPSVTDDIPTTPVLDDLASGEDGGPAAGAPDEEPVARRFTVFTARYRLVLKGPDRGKWEASTVAEADAPLLTVEAVVRGVQRRSGDVDDPERMSGDEVRAELARMDAAVAALRGPASLRAG